MPWRNPFSPRRRRACQRLHSRWFAVGMRPQCPAPGNIVAAAAARVFRAWRSVQPPRQIPIGSAADPAIAVQVPTPQVPTAQAPAGDAQAQLPIIVSPSPSRPLLYVQPAPPQQGFAQQQPMPQQPAIAPRTYGGPPAVVPNQRTANPRHRRQTTASRIGSLKENGIVAAPSDQQHVQGFRLERRSRLRRNGPSMSRASRRACRSSSRSAISRPSP